MKREYVAIITIKKDEGGLSTALDVKNHLYSSVTKMFPNAIVNDVKEFELETTKKGTKYNVVDSA